MYIYVLVERIGKEYIIDTYWTISYFDFVGDYEFTNRSVNDMTFQNRIEIKFLVLPVDLLHVSIHLYIKPKDVIQSVKD